MNLIPKQEEIFCSVACLDDKINKGQCSCFNRGTNLAKAPDHGMCQAKNCKNKATIDYNGHGDWVCQYHYDKFSDYFDEEYR